jgi:outer membrane protein assembly complex protein YaeT
VPATEVDEETHTARITFTLKPGQKVNFGEITIAGTKQVEDYVVQRQLAISEGDRYSGSRVQDSQEDIFNLDLFRAVTPRIKNMEEEGAPVDIEFELTERKPRTGRLGVGASSIESVRYLAEWTHRNLFSEAETLKLSASVSRYFQNLEAELHEPFFFNRKTSTTYKLFGINQTTITTDPTGIIRSVFDLEDPFPAYDFLLGGGEWRVEHDFNRKLGGVFGLNFTATDYYNIDEDADEDLLDGVEDNKLFIQFLEGQWNARNSDINPRRGQLWRAKLEHSNDAVFSDSSFVKIGLDGRHYFPLSRRNVLATRLKIGAIKAYGGTDTIPSNVRFYAGGPGSVRGYSINRLGPLDSSGNPIGGSSLLEGSVELRFPIVGSLVGNAFVDFGNVYQPEFTYRLEDLKYSVGAGIGYNTPVGPLRLEVAIAIDPDENDITSPVIFSIGHAF